MFLPTSASPNTPPPPFQTERPPYGPFCTVSSRHFHPPHCARCAGNGELPTLPPNPAHSRSRKRAIRRSVETKEQNANYRQRPASSGLERSERGSYVS